LSGSPATTENQSNIVNHRFRLPGVPCSRGAPGDTYVNRPTVTGRESTHIDTAFMGLTSSDGVTVDCKLPARRDTDQPFFPPRDHDSRQALAVFLRQARTVSAAKEIERGAKRGANGGRHQAT
jgi:hypothetical protein